MREKSIDQRILKELFPKLDAQQRKILETEALPLLENIVSAPDEETRATGKQALNNFLDNPKKRQERAFLEKTDPDDETPLSRLLKLIRSQQTD